MLKKIFSFSLLLFLLNFSHLNSQVIQYHEIYENIATNYQYTSHNRVKYDASGNIYVLSYDGTRFYEMNNKSGYFSALKPIGRARLSSSNLNLTHYDFDIDTSGVIHIAFASHSIGSETVHLYYTNSQIDTVFYLGSDQLPIHDFQINSFKLNVIRTTDNKIVVNYIHFFLGKRTPPITMSQISWTQLINPSQNNFVVNTRKITIPFPSEFQYSYIPYMNVFANKELYVQLLFNHVRGNWLENLEVRHIFKKYSFQDSTTLMDDVYFTYVGSNTSENPHVVSYPLFKEDYNNGAIHLSYIRVYAYTGNTFRRDLLSNRIFTLDRQNNLHVIEFNNNLNSYEYRCFTNIPVNDFSSGSIYHRVDGTKFNPFNLSAPNYINQSIGGLAAWNSNDAVILFNFKEYLIRQKQGIFTYNLILPFDFYSVRTLHATKHNNKIYLLNSRDGYAQVNDTTGAIYLFELLQTNNQFVVAIDTSHIRKINVPANIGLRPRYSSLRPIVKVDKNQNIHLLIFKVIGYNTMAGMDLGQWYYYKLNQNFALEGGYAVTVNDTLNPSTTFDFDIDNNGVVHFTYLKYTSDFKTIIRYTNNSSGSFVNPIVIGDTISSMSSSIWISIKAAQNGNAYVVYRPYIPSGVYVIYGNQNGFSRPKRLFVSENWDISGGRNKVAFDVDLNGVLHVFDVVSSLSIGTAIYYDVVMYIHRVIRDSVTNIPSNVGLFLNLANTQCILMERDKNGLVHVTGYQSGKIFYLNSQNNFSSVRSYNLSDFGLLRFLRSNEYPFMDHFKILYPDETQNKVYIRFGAALNDVILAWLPYSTTGIERAENSVPSNFVLNQNYPNPFNPKTKIEFELPYRENVKLVIYDVLGREVMKIVDKELDVGKYVVDVDLSGFSTGVYFYRIEAGEFRDTKKMLLLK
ncbi:MAG: T9SS type A sorting domain-containing protein [Ignavibacteria bacterium]|nr:T9SS type A sorting domain-containing protein [Ignavibacteria bacterium]